MRIELHRAWPIMNRIALAAILFFVSHVAVAVTAARDFEDEFFSPAERDPIKRTQPIPAKYAGVKEITLAVERHVVHRMKEPEKGKPIEQGMIDHAYHVRIINPTTKTMVFDGYGEGCPWHGRQSWQNGKWTDYRVGWFCGTGLRTCVIPPGRSAVFAPSADEYFFPVRFSVGYLLTTNGKADVAATENRVLAGGTVWTERLETNSYLEPPPPTPESTFKKRSPNTPRIR